METLTTTISIIFLLGLIVFPIFLFIKIKQQKKLKFVFWRYLIIGLLVTAIIIVILAWWADFSDQLLLNHYGYNFEATSWSDRFSQVSEENIQRVKQLEESHFFVIGWQISAMLTFPFYLPYLLLVYPLGQVIRVIRKKLNDKKHTSTS